jgi:hypothetical protein
MLLSTDALVARGPGTRLLPSPRGPLSEALLAALAGPVGQLPDLVAAAQGRAMDGASTLDDDDVQLTLYLAYELHYRGLPAVDDVWEWHPDLVAVVRSLEAPFERDLRVLAAPRLAGLSTDPTAVSVTLTALVDADDGPSLSKHLACRAEPWHYQEFLAHRSIYHLREADAHTWAIPRLVGEAKAALVEIQADEYGGGRAEWMHSALFARTMRGLGMSDAYGLFVDAVPACTLGWANAMTFLGLHRRLRGAAAGHLAALEMTSSLPNRRYGNGLRRLGLDESTTRFFDEHVEADAVHEQIAVHDLAGRLALASPDLTPDILLGGAVALATDARVATVMLDAWAAGQSSLRACSSTDVPAGV